MTARLLVVEDDQGINEVVTTKLRQEGYVCDQAFSGTEAALMLKETAGKGYDLVVCDLMLPGMPGERLVELVRKSGVDVPVIVISARTQISDKIDLLRLGADDYLAKPFDLDELVARVEVQLRRRTGGSGTGLIRRFGRWSVCSESRTLVIDGRDVPLTRTEFDIVEALVGRPGKVFTKAELFELLWDEDCPEDDNSVTVHVSNLRAKLRLSGTDAYIKTVWGLGFKLESEGQ